MMILVTAMFLLTLVLLTLYLYVSGVFTNRRTFQCGFYFRMVQQHRSELAGSR